MTIKGLNKFIKDKYSHAIESCWLSDFKGYRIFIDADNILYHHMSVANKKAIQNTDFAFAELDRSMVLNNFIHSMINLCLDFLKLDIMPVLVFDGKPPEAKSNTKKKRNNKKEEIRTKIAKNKEKMSVFDTLSIPQSDIEQHKKLLLQDNYITREEVSYFKIILSSIGLPIIEANCESEKLCSAFCIEGKGIAVYSQDSDCLAHGNYLTIRDLNAKVFRPETNKYDREVDFIIIDKLLHLMNLEYAEFVDLCITSGTDYNDNIRNFGIAKMYKQIKTWKRIENLPEPHWSALKYQEVRNLFSYQSSDQLCSYSSLDLVNEVPSSLKSILESVDCLDLYNGLVEMIEKFKTFQIKERNYMIHPNRQKSRFVIVDD